MIITDKNRIKEYCNHHRCMILSKEWDELWRTSVCVRGILVENIAEDKIEDKMFGIETVDKRIEKSSKPLLPYAQYTTYILMLFEMADENTFRWLYCGNEDPPYAGSEILEDDVLSGVREFYNAIKWQKPSRWGSGFTLYRKGDEKAGMLGLNILVMIGFSVDIKDAKLEDGKR